MAKEVNVGLLVQLADKEVSNTVSDFGALPIDIKDSLIKKQAEQRQKVVDAAADEIVAILSDKDEFLRQQAIARASLVEQIANIDSLMSETQRATSFGLATQNFIPLAKQIGKFIPGSTKAELTKIPKDWTAPVEAANTASPAAEAQSTAAPAAAAA